MTSAAAPAAYAGRFRLLDSTGAELESVDARFEVGADAVQVHPRNDAALRLDFADLDALELGDYVLAVQLCTGERAEFSMLGRRFGDFADALGLALRNFQARNLLLEEPVGGERFACDVDWGDGESPAEVRVYATSLAVVPRTRTPFGVALGELTSTAFDEDRYAIVLASQAATTTLLRLGRQTQPCLRLIESRLAELRTRTAAALAHLAPSLPSISARRLCQAMPDGVPARRSQLDAIAPGLWDDLLRAAVGSAELRASFDALASLCPAAEVAVGIKETNSRQDQDGANDGESDSESTEPNAQETASEEAAEDESASDGEKSPMAGRTVWYAFPILDRDRRRPGNAVAIEAVSRGGRATYLFRIAPAAVYRDASDEDLLSLARERIRSVSRAMVALTFKREPIYLTDEQLRSGRYARYRLAMRLSAPLRAARTTFVGRAVHGPGWRRQLDAALGRALE